MEITDYHAKLYAHELTRRCASDEVDKLAPVLADAQVDLNPHQVEAALFAFQNPLGNGAILADEVGLGKTIEAALLLAQKWAEGKRRLLVILPANLRKQWSQELADKLDLPTAILETRTFNEHVKNGNLNPFAQPAVVLCSFQFARNKAPYITQTAWNLVVADEAHRLRNVYKPGNKIAQAIKQAIAPFPKDKLTLDLIKALPDKKPSRVVFLDRGFRDNDQVKANAAKLSASKAGENFKKFKTV